MTYMPFSSYIFRSVLLISSPYNPAAYYVVITAYASMITWGIYLLVMA
jgi:hypothetical protein